MCYWLSAGGKGIPRRPKILLVSNVDAPFVQADRDILGELGDVRFLDYRGRRSLGRLVLEVATADLTVCWFVLGYATTAVLLGSLLSKPTILIAGGWDVAAVPEIGYGAMTTTRRIRLTSFALRHATSVLAVSEHTKTEVNRWVNRDITVVYNGVDTDYYSPAGSREKQVLTVAGVGNEVRYRKKGIGTFLKVAERLPEVRFVIVGRNSLAWDNRIRSIAPPNVYVAGQVSKADLRDLYRRSRVYAQLSVHESFGVALAEGMACGCVPVATDRAALPEVVGDAGYIVPVGDVERIGESLTRALADEKTGWKARERVETKFSLRARKRALREIVEGVCSRRAGI